MPAKAKRPTRRQQLDPETKRSNDSLRLWSMGRKRRIAAMYACELTQNQLCEWSRRAPHEVPKLNGEFWWIAITTPEVAD